MKNKTKETRAILKEMKEIYYPDNKSYGEFYLDWMGYKLDEQNYPSYHHIEKASVLKQKNESAKPTISNGAYLGEYSHTALHYIKTIDPELYDAWNYLFLQINRMKCYPIDDIWKMIHHLQAISMEAIENAQNSKTYKKKNN